ncbi:DUF4304 domain-containing protein [Frankia sp. AiPs1]|uniref:hypothetical protein n=1 Tax=Frankia sp. AiPa1 TaxID=573492 RepID=UPI00202B1F3C|nr:hypothetical protein [Frankia sp. AiPa1]MCL9762066.1 hypothetical protein [Frankia sp. AiPa1]
MRDGAAGADAGGASTAEFALAAMEVLEPLAEKYGLFLAERTCWHLLFASGRRILDVACDPWTCWALGARVGMRDPDGPGSLVDGGHVPGGPGDGLRALSVQDVLHAVHGMRENAWPWIAADSVELRQILRTLAVLLDRYCAELFLDDEAFARAERLVLRATAERRTFLREFEEH